MGVEDIPNMPGKAIENIFDAFFGPGGVVGGSDEETITGTNDKGEEVTVTIRKK